MGATGLEVADIFRQYGDAYRQHVGGIAPAQERVMRAIQLCRTAALGGHLYVCNECGVLTERYNSCRNRHCPKCQWLDRQQWLEKRQEELLPVTYFWLAVHHPVHGLGYLARYTHRVAISNDRLLKIEDDRVHFRFKDYKNGGEWKDTSLGALVFLRRFLLHVLPDGFQRIRYYGLLAHRYRSENLERCRRLLGVVAQSAPEEGSSQDEPKETWEERMLRQTGIDPRVCPSCGQGRLVLLHSLEPQARETLPEARAPP